MAVCELYKHGTSLSNMQTVKSSNPITRSQLCKEWDVGGGFHSFRH
jgi:hypothetical protein